MDDPDDPDRERYWDGTSWTDHRRARSSAAPIPPAEPPSPTPTTSTSGEAEARKTKSGCLPLVGLVVVLAVVFSVCSSDTDGVGGDNGSDIGAHVVCQDFVRDRLKSPSTAGFPLASDATITGGPTSYTVRAHVDSENGFGAEIRTNYTCQVTYQGDDRWRLNDLVFDD